jgi:bifunctional polynucleotide phosphatase/kinase
MPPKSKKPKLENFEKKPNPKVPTLDPADGFTVCPKDLLYRVHPRADASGKKKVLGLDLDNTLIRRRPDSLAKGGLPDDKDDFELYNACVKDILKGYVDEGYAVVAFSNQGAIKTSMTGVNSVIIRGLCDNVSKALGDEVPLHFVLATTDPKKDNHEYRKPSVGMWKIFIDEMNGGVDPDLSECLYVGDAAGRPFDLQNMADSDKKFAENLGIRFMTPDELFGAPGTGKEENQAMGNAFLELANAFVMKTEDEKKHFRARALRNAGNAIKLFGEVITSVDQLSGKSKVKGIGDGSKKLVQEYLETGSLAEIEKVMSGEWEKERLGQENNEEKAISKAAEVGQGFL